MGRALVGSSVLQAALFSSLAKQPKTCTSSLVCSPSLALGAIYPQRKRLKDKPIASIHFNSMVLQWGFVPYLVRPSCQVSPRVTWYCTPEYRSTVGYDKNDVTYQGGKFSGELDWPESREFLFPGGKNSPLLYSE